MGWFVFWFFAFAVLVYVISGAGQRIVECEHRGGVIVKTGAFTDACVKRLR